MVAARCHDLRPQLSRRVIHSQETSIAVVGPCDYRHLMNSVIKPQVPPGHGPGWADWQRPPPSSGSATPVAVVVIRVMASLLAVALVAVGGFASYWVSVWSALCLTDPTEDDCTAITALAVIPIAAAVASVLPALTSFFVRRTLPALACLLAIPLACFGTATAIAMAAAVVTS